MNHIRTIVFTLALTLGACASMTSYDLPKTQAQLGQALQKTEGIVQKAQGDYDEKKLLVSNLKKAGAPAFKELETDIDRRIKNMETSLGSITASRKEMVEAKSDLASLGYQRKQVLSGEKEFGLVDEAVKRFERAAGTTNSALLDYSRESNSLADLVSQKKLYYQFDVGDFQKRVQKSIQVSTENQKTMLRELNRGENILNGASSEDRLQREGTYNEMQETAKEYSSKAGRYSEISKAVNVLTGGTAKYSTLEKNWTEVLELVREHDQLSNELAGIYGRFQTQMDLLRNPSKRVR